jgi:hypothetical protein
MKKMVLFIFLVLFLLSMNVFALEFQLSANYGTYSKDNNLFKQLYGKDKKISGVGVEIFPMKFNGFYIDANYMTSSGESSYYKQPLKYSEFQLSAGFKLRFTIIRFSPLYELNLYAKGGALLISYTEYTENFKEKISGNAFGLTAGGGVILWLKKIGVGLEVIKNFAKKEVDIQGFDNTEEITFSGLRIALKMAIRF